MGKKFSSDSPTLAEIRRKKKPNSRDAFIVLDPEMARVIAEKEQEIARAKANTTRTANLAGKSLAESAPDLEQLEKELDDLWEEAGDAVVKFTFQDPGKKKFDDLVSAHPPTEKQKKEWKDEGGEGALGFNPDTFVPELIALTCIQPKMTVDEAIEMCDEWGTGDISILFTTALLTCQEAAPVPLSGRTRTATAETSSSG